MKSLIVCLVARRQMVVVSYDKNACGISTKLTKEKKEEKETLIHRITDQCPLNNVVQNQPPSTNGMNGQQHTHI